MCSLVQTDRKWNDKTCKMKDKCLGFTLQQQSTKETYMTILSMITDLKLLLLNKMVISIQNIIE